MVFKGFEIGILLAVFLFFIFFCMGLVIGEDFCRGADLNGDNKVDVDDLNIFDRYYKSSDCGAPDWCGGADLNGDGVVDEDDFDLISSSFGNDDCTAISKPIVDCVPNLDYGDWSECDVVYGFDDLLKGSEDLVGESFRSYVDFAGCVKPSYEIQECSVELEVFARKALWCGESYYEIYEKSSGKLLSRIKDNKQKEIPSLDVVFSQIDSGYCDYCFDGFVTGDEEGVDCGGGCKVCVENPAPFVGKDYGLFLKLGLLVLLLGFVVVYFFISRHLKGERKFMVSVGNLPKRVILKEKEELFG